MSSTSFLGAAAAYNTVWGLTVWGLAAKKQPAWMWPAAVVTGTLLGVTFVAFGLIGLVALLGVLSLAAWLGPRAPGGSGLATGLGFVWVVTWTAAGGIAGTLAVGLPVAGLAVRASRRPPGLVR